MDKRQLVLVAFVSNTFVYKNVSLLVGEYTRRVTSSSVILLARQEAACGRTVACGSLLCSVGKQTVLDLRTDKNRRHVVGLTDITGGTW